MNQGVMSIRNELYVGKLVYCPYYSHKRQRMLKDAQGNNKLYQAHITWLARRGLRDRERKAMIKYVDSKPWYSVRMLESDIVHTDRESKRLQDPVYRRELAHKGALLFKRNSSIAWVKDNWNWN